ncbi:MAG: GntR family transcriptional regulator [Phycisphaerae bacterium]
MTTLDTECGFLYKRVEHQLRTWISEGYYRPGDRLPSIRELSAKLSVNYLTVRQALARLSAEGLVSTSQGRGTFVEHPTAGAKTVALVVPHLGSPLSDMVSQGICSVLDEHQIESVILNSHDSVNAEARNLRQIARRNLGGAIVFSTMGLPTTLAILKMVVEGRPVVLVDRFFEDVPTWHVRADNIQGGYLATRHLLDIGRRRIGFVSDLTNSTTRHRLEGYRRALASAGVVFDEKLVGAVPVATNDTFGTTRQLLAQTPRPDAIFYGNDFRAMEGMQAIKAAGLRIPEDIAIVGFDDLPTSRLTDPPLTTIRQDGFQLGKIAAELFLEQLAIAPSERALHPKWRIVPVELIRRNSA